MSTTSSPLKGIPELETDRLFLRSHKLADMPDCVSMWSDPVVTRYTIGEASTEQRTWLRFLSYQGLWTMLGFGYWAVEEKKSGKFIGELGFADFKRTLQPSISGTPELGWVFATHAHGKGYATEALKEATRWGDENLRTDRMVCIIKPENLPSIRVAEKIGFLEFARTESSNPAERNLFFAREVK
jgi:RimJ/RimL family protein N-acetyltransferase